MLQLKEHCLVWLLAPHHLNSHSLAVYKLLTTSWMSCLYSSLLHSFCHHPWGCTQTHAERSRELITHPNAYTFVSFDGLWGCVQTTIGGLEHGLTPLAEACAAVHVFDQPTEFGGALWLPYRRQQEELEAAVRTCAGPIKAVFGHADVVSGHLLII